MVFQETWVRFLILAASLGQLALGLGVYPACSTEYMRVRL
jgi:hypothetical protein